MCGIAGVMLRKGGSPGEPMLRKMTGVLSHRGPDGEGVYINGPVGLGHRRLSIIDLEGGVQPMKNEDASMAIVFNGEIYNYSELSRFLLEKGHSFRTNSDTEVILHAYEEFGRDCLRHLRGMFAFAIWDGSKNELFLARDRLGIKPLYYAVTSDRFVFGSEIKSLLQVPGIDCSLDPYAVDDYLTFMYIPAPKTIFRGIRKLPPGRMVTVSSSQFSEREYWDVSFMDTGVRDENECAEALMEKLEESVRIHMVSDVPFGAFLSGGVDSSAVVGIMSRLMNRPVITASIGFEDDRFDELRYARIVSDRFATDTYEKTVRADAAEIIDSLVWYFDEPFADLSMVPTYYVSGVAREGVKVCLSGDGGDENFAGYRRYKFDLFENRIRSLLPRQLRRPLFGALGALYPKADWLPRVFRAKTMLTNLSLSAEEGYYHTMRWFTPEMKKLLYRESLKRDLGDYDPFAVMKGYFDKSKGLDPLSRIQYVDIKTYLVDDILTKVDRASMAHSLEVRVPLLDHEVVEFAASIPPCFKLRGGSGKYILKKALEGFVPGEILHRPKMGFSVPLALWFRDGIRELFEGTVLSDESFLSGIFDLDAVRVWWHRHQRGVQDYSYHFWALLVLERWARRFLG